MHHQSLYNYGFGTIWNDIFVTCKEGYRTSVTDYHEHDFYEINLILSGNVKILTKDGFEEGAGSRIILTRPHTPRTMFPAARTRCTADCTWFSPIALLPLPFTNGKAYPTFSGKMGRSSAYRLRKRRNSGSSSSRSTAKINYPAEAISYIENNYADKITADILAK